MHKETTRPQYWILDFKKELPDILGKTVISPLHYGETVEISFVRGIEGETFINGKRFDYHEKNVFFIPPKYLHTSTYRHGGIGKNDMVCAFHINVDALAPFIDVKKILLKENRTLFELAFRCDDFDMLWELTQLIVDERRSFVSRAADTLRFFEMLFEQKMIDVPVAEYSKAAIDIIEFVEEKYGSKLTLQHAAEYFGYSKQYFCKWCKSEIGVAFNEFLNAVRITHARNFLTGGCSVEETAEKCGFSDPSYFSKVFKKFVGTTPKAYTINKTRTGDSLRQ